MPAHRRRGVAGAGRGQDYLRIPPAACGFLKSSLLLIPLVILAQQALLDAVDLSFEDDSAARFGGCANLDLDETIMVRKCGLYICHVSRPQRSSD